MKNVLILPIGLSIVLTLGSPSPAGELLGQVTDLLTGSAVAGAKVHLFKKQKGTDYRAATDYEGKFSIRNIDEGSYDVVIYHPNYLKKHAKGVEIKLNQATVLNHVQLTMELAQSPLVEQQELSSRYGRITGQVLDKKGNAPLADAIVRLYSSDGKSANIGARTKEDGKFVILTVPEGIYKVEISYSPTYHRLRLKDVKVEPNRDFMIDIVKLPEKLFEEGDTVYVQDPCFPRK